MEGARVLVVDDEPLNIEYLYQELSDRGYVVDRAHNGIEALERIAELPPDLVLLDVLMPGIDGIEVCRRLKDDTGTQLIPVVIMTALTDMDSRVRGIEAGADDFLSKPVDERELFARVRTALRMKASIDGTVKELDSATRQIERLGPHDEDVTVVFGSAPDPTGRQRFESSIEEQGGIAAAPFERTGTGVVGVFRGEDAAARARSAVEAALRLGGEGWSAGVAEGSALIGVHRRAGRSGNEWTVTADGPVVHDARIVAEAARSGQLLVSRQILDQLGDRYQAQAVDDSHGLAVFRISHEQSPDPAGPYEVRFPTEFTGLLPVLQERWQIEDLYATRTLSGKSGARVLLVDISCDGFSGQAILKLERHASEQHDLETEAGRHRHAIERHPSYASAHLPRLLHLMSHGRDTATLSTIAAGGLEYCQPWFRTGYEAQVASGERISNDVLESWNEAYELAPGLVLPSHLLEQWLKYRLDRHEGRLDAALRDVIGIDPAVPTFFVEGQWFPNPLVFARGQSASSEPPLRAAVGQVHGDMHGYNILTRHGRADVSDYFLIDLAFYEPGQFLFYDHGYLELAYLLRTREDAGPRRWIELLDGVHSDSPANADDIGVARVVSALREGQRRWVDEHEGDRTSYMASQMMLGRIGAGLNYSNKRVSAQMKMQAFLFAAAAFKHFIELHQMDWPLDGAAATLPVAAPEGAAARSGEPS